MNKVICIDEANEEVQIIGRNLVLLSQKKEEITKEISKMEEQGFPETYSHLKHLKNVLADITERYNRKKRQVYYAKDRLIRELENNKNLIIRNYGIVDLYEHYQRKREYVNPRKLETQIRNLDEKVEKQKEKVKKNKRDEEEKYKLRENSIDLFEYKIIKVIYLLGDTNPEIKIKQYDILIEMLQKHFNPNLVQELAEQGNIDEFFELIEDSLMTDIQTKQAEDTQTINTKKKFPERVKAKLNDTVKRVIDITEGTDEVDPTTYTDLEKYRDASIDKWGYEVYEDSICLEI